MASEGDEDLVNEMRNSTRRMIPLDLSPLQAGIVRELMDGKRNLSEIALKIYGVRYDDDSYEAHYSRLRRAVAGLEKAGVVARGGLLGRGKPYHLTQFGVARLASISPGMNEPKLVSSLDIVLLVSTPAMALVIFLVRPEGLGLLLSLSFLGYLLGLTTMRAVMLLGKVA